MTFSQPFKKTPENRVGGGSGLPILFTIEELQIWSVVELRIWQCKQGRRICPSLGLRLLKQFKTLGDESGSLSDLKALDVGLHTLRLCGSEDSVNGWADCGGGRPFSEWGLGIILHTHNEN